MRATLSISASTVKLLFLWRLTSDTHGRDTPSNAAALACVKFSEAIQAATASMNCCFVSQYGPQHVNALAKDQAEFRQQAPDAVDADGAIRFEAFTQSVYAQTWMTFLAKSAPTRVISDMGLLLHKRFQIEFNNPILTLDAVAWKWEVPSYSLRGMPKRLRLSGTPHVQRWAPACLSPMCASKQTHLRLTHTLSDSRAMILK